MCSATTCNQGYQLTTNNPATCDAIVGFPSIYLTAYISTIPEGQATAVSFGASNVTSIVVMDGNNKIYELKNINSGASGSFNVSPAATTTYNVAATGPKGTNNQKITITVLPVNNSLFKQSGNLLTAILENPIPNQDNGAPFSNLLSWVNQNINLQMLVITAKTAIGTKVINTVYNPAGASLSNFRNFSMVPVTYTIMASAGGFFNSTFAEMSSISIVPPKPPLSPTPGVAADCNGTYQYLGADGYMHAGLLDPGTGNVNNTGSGSDAAACADFFSQKQQECIALNGPSCKAFGYLQTREPSINNAVVVFRVFPVPSQNRTSSGVCEPSFYTANVATPIVSSGPQFIVSTDANSLIEDCQTISTHDYLEIGYLGSQPGGSGYVLTAVQSLQLTDLQNNSALINYVAPPQ